MISKLPALLLVAAIALGASVPTSLAKDPPKPLRVLLITGGCCHSYATQKDILKHGLEARAHVIVDQLHSDNTTTNPPLAFYGNPDYAKGYDVVIHDECAARMDDPAILEMILAPHRNGIPGVNLHCAMHSYRVGNFRQPTAPGSVDGLWFEYLGVQSSAHGPKVPVKITYLDTNSPITKGLTGWTTGDEELYNNIQVMPTAQPLARGYQHQPPARNAPEGSPYVDAEAVVVWTNLYRGVRVFSTTIGHWDETVADDRYLDLVTRGLLWSCDKLNDQYLKN